MSVCARIEPLQFFPMTSQEVGWTFSSEIKSVNKGQNHDLKLLRRIAVKDREAFAEFYDRHAALLFSIACKILQSPSEAEDVLQDTFARVWEKAGKFDPKLGQANSWVATLVRNKAVDKIRASDRRVRLAQQSATEFTVVGEVSESINEAVRGHEQAELIHSAIVRLPAEQRQAIELAYFSGLTQAEISSKLSEPLGTVKARIRRGLLKLRNLLEGLR